MKQLIYFTLLIFLISCGPDDVDTNSPICIDSEYNHELKIQLGDIVCFPNGNSFEVKTIEDQFCCCFCKCISAGELGVSIETTDSDGKKDLFTFGSISYTGVNNIFDGYIISEFNYLYDGKPDSLPLCIGEYDANKTELILRISPE